MLFAYMYMTQQQNPAELSDTYNPCVDIYSFSWEPFLEQRSSIEKFIMRNPFRFIQINHKTQYAKLITEEIVIQNFSSRDILI